MNAHHQLPITNHLGIIAGGGTLPERLLHACDRRGIEVFVIGLEGQTDRNLMAGRKHLWTRVGAAGQIIQTLKAHKIRDLVLIGSVSRPSLSELKPDWRTAAFLMKIGMRSLMLGDDGLLSAIRAELENEGFIIHGVQDFAEDLLAPPGALGKYSPGKADQEDINRGLDVARAIGALDVGQAVVIQEGLVLGMEAIEGTDALINRCGELKHAGKGPILVKLCKPQQDTSLDMPTIGPTTVDHAAFRGFRGIIFQARKTLLIDPQQVAESADAAKMFVYGVE